MEIANSSWEMWDFPETQYQTPSSCPGWSDKVQSKVIERLVQLLSTLPQLKLIFTHNLFGEYGHVDHRNVHDAVLQAYLMTYSGNIHAPQILVFMPRLNYSDYNDRLDSPPMRCEESQLHKRLLDSYFEDGSLDNAVVFRDLCYEFCHASLDNSALLNTRDSKNCDFHLKLGHGPRDSCKKPRATVSEGRNSDVLQAEPLDEQRFWEENEDRVFMMSFYPTLGTMFKTILDIGARGYNKRIKHLLGLQTTYFQLEPAPPAELNNNGTLKCLVQDAVLMYPQFVRFFDVIIDFVVLGWPEVPLSNSDVHDYIRNIRALLKPDGLYVLKIDNGAHERINLAINVLPYFDFVNFSRFENGLRLDAAGSQVFFLRLKSS